jgi:hypothetical protein
VNDYERHAARMFGSEIAIFGILGSHGFRVRAPDRYGSDPIGRVLVDAVTGEPIAAMSLDEARELAAWLERERPLLARPVRVLTREEWALVAGTPCSDLYM